MLGMLAFSATFCSLERQRHTICNSALLQAFTSYPIAQKVQKIFSICNLVLVSYENLVSFILPGQTTPHKCDHKL